MEFVGAGLGEDFDPSVAQLVVFRGERILVDANLADRRLRRKLARGESVDVDLAAVRPGGRPGQRLQVRLQFVRIVGQRVEIFTRKHDRARIVRRDDVDGRRLSLTLDFFLLHCISRAHMFSNCEVDPVVTSRRPA